MGDLIGLLILVGGTALLYLLLILLYKVGQRIPAEKDPCGNDNIKREPWKYM